MDFKEKCRLSEEELEKLAKNDQKDYADTANKYPYGKEENDRVLALSDEEFEKEFGEKYRSMLKEYEEYENEAAEFQTYTYDQVMDAKEKYEHYKNARNRIKDDGER